MPVPPPLRLRNGRVIDPASGSDTRQDVFIAAGRISAIGAAPADFKPQRTLDASGLVVAPGLVDLSAALERLGKTNFRAAPALLRDLLDEDNRRRGR